MYECNNKRISREDSSRQYNPPSEEIEKDEYIERIEYWINIVPEIITRRKTNIVLPKKPRIGTLNDLLN